MTKEEYQQVIDEYYGDKLQERIDRHWELCRQKSAELDEIKRSGCETCYASALEEAKRSLEWDESQVVAEWKLYASIGMTCRMKRAHTPDKRVDDVYSGRLRSVCRQDEIVKGEAAEQATEW